MGIKVALVFEKRLDKEFWCITKEGKLGGTTYHMLIGEWEQADQIPKDVREEILLELPYEPNLDSKMLWFLNRLQDLQQLRSE